MHGLVREKFDNFWAKTPEAGCLPKCLSLNMEDTYCVTAKHSGRRRAIVNTRKSENREDTKGKSRTWRRTRSKTLEGWKTHINFSKLSSTSAFLTEHFCMAEAPNACSHIACSGCCRITEHKPRPIAFEHKREHSKVTAYIVKLRTMASPVQSGICACRK